jgi:magnesium chelatase accessory protein
MRALDWNREGRDWPQRENTRFVDTSGLKWRIVQAGAGPTVLLLHGTGASAHSWRGIIALLGADFTVLAPDLPGHGFTRGRPPKGLSLEGISGALEALLCELENHPALIVGHSAGAAIALDLASRRRPDLPVIGFSPALMPFPGLAARLFPALAKMLFVNPFVPRIFAAMARAPGEAERFLVRSTGSRIDAEGLRCYATLLGDSRHCEGALGMMANWNLAALAERLPAIRNPALLVHGGNDTAIPLASVTEACALLPHGTLEMAIGLGHLAHEEDPAGAAERIRAFARAHAILPAGGIAA